MLMEPVVQLVREDTNNKLKKKRFERVVCAGKMRCCYQMVAGDRGVGTLGGHCGLGGDRGSDGGMET